MDCVIGNIKKLKDDSSKWYSSDDQRAIGDTSERIQMGMKTLSESTITRVAKNPMGHGNMMGSLVVPKTEVDTVRQHRVYTDDVETVQDKAKMIRTKTRNLHPVKSNNSTLQKRDKTLKQDQCLTRMENKTWRKETSISEKKQDQHQQGNKYQKRGRGQITQAIEEELFQRRILLKQDKLDHEPHPADTRLTAISLP